MEWFCFCFLFFFYETRCGASRRKLRAPGRATWGALGARRELRGSQVLAVPRGPASREGNSRQREPCDYSKYYQTIDDLKNQVRGIF